MIIEMLSYPIIFGTIVMSVLLVIGMAVYHNKLSKLKRDMQKLFRELVDYTENIPKTLDGVTTTCANNIANLVHEQLFGTVQENAGPTELSISDVEFGNDIRPVDISDISDTKPLATGITMEELEDVSVFRTDFLEERFRGKDRVGSKCVVIRKSYHEMLRAVCRIAGNDELTMSGYLDNILTDHFNRYGTEIEAMASTNNKTNGKSL